MLKDIHHIIILASNHIASKVISTLNIINTEKIILPINSAFFSLLLSFVSPFIIIFFSIFETMILIKIYIHKNIMTPRKTLPNIFGIS